MNIRRAMVLASLFAIAGGFAGPAFAGHGGYARIHTFCSLTNCQDGAMPDSPLLADAGGNLFGTAYSGGTGNCGTETCGTIFEMTPRRPGGYRFSVLHDFCSEFNCGDGVLPLAGVIMDVNGNLYGTATNGGLNGGGTAFELVRHKNGTNRFKLLYPFCVRRPNCDDGAAPEFDGLSYQGAAVGALYDGTSPLYGTAQSGGAGGVVYALNPPTADSKKWSESVLYSFCSQSNCTDGVLPQHGLFVDAAGNLYGTTSSGGAYGQGVIFELSQSGGSWSETVLYSFCPGGGSCTDGTYPSSPLMMDSSGNLYGTTANGGNGGNGVLFRLVPNGTNSTYAVLYTFCSVAGCADGAVPSGKLLLDGSGDILGSTIIGGTDGSGVIYDFDGSALHVLHMFCRRSDCADGGNPVGGLAAGADGNLYGTTSSGGDAQQQAGVVFRLTR